MSKLITLMITVMVLSGCASKTKSTCDDVSCRPQSDNHHLVIWWPQSMRESDQSYSKMPVR
ncbi:type III secretion protein HrpT [Pantoea sp. Al-1710]|uniref:Type III secretion protein HrpT n=1 Tax=Candidatus Pantoea communis TaxID=2608354 RepID=A0ABX0RL55_9GAMM|nr:type III secretion protein HrpT [Pantoea sp. Cy-640]NIG17351.1 type III secretion protein HrpT [Pantoea communis]